MAKRAQDPLLFTFFNEIGIIEQLARNRLERVLPDGLRMSHFGVLNHFARLGGEHSPTQLAKAFQVTKAAMTNTIGRLEARGLVEVNPDPEDGRAKRVGLTGAGLRTRNDCIAAIRPMLADLGARISPDKFEQALPLLQELRTVLDTSR